MARFVVVALALSLALAGTAAGAGVQSGKLVTYVHSGGFTGDRDTLTVFRSGRADSSNGLFGLTTKRRLSLERALRAARFATLRKEYVPVDPVVADVDVVLVDVPVVDVVAVFVTGGPPPVSVAVV